jgi:archaellum component FlaF (FlaF/FlaG flagellin family)
MTRIRRNNIDRKTNKPDPIRTESTWPDVELNRAQQVRRDDDVIRTPRRTLYDIDFAIKWYIENVIQPQVTHNKELIRVPVIFANGEKWDNVRKLGYLRDEKGMLQSPIIVLKRNTMQERDQMKKLDINRPLNGPMPGNQVVYRTKYNRRNTYEQQLFPIPTDQGESNELYLINIPEYVDVEYDMMLWTDFTTQMNELVEQLMPYGGFAWGNEENAYQTLMRAYSFETVNTVGEDRLVRATTQLTVKGNLLAEQEIRMSTLQKAYSIKKVRFDTVLDVGVDLFSTIVVPDKLLAVYAQVISGNNIIVSTSNGGTTSIDSPLIQYLVNVTERQATRVDSQTVTVTAAAAINPSSQQYATVNEFDIYINGQYVDKQTYTWTPGPTSQTITFNTTILGYTIDVTDVVIVKGRWA